MAITVKNSRRRRFVTFTTALLAVGVISVAGAAWLASGDGEGYAQADTAEDLTTEDLEQITTESLTQDLYPGSDEGDLIIEISNPNRYPVTIDTLSQDGEASMEAAGPVTEGDTCDAADVTLDSQTNLDLDVPAEDSEEFTLTDVVNMDGDAGNQCQGATFEIPVTFSGVSDAS